MRAVRLLAAVLLLAACGGDSNEPKLSLTGTWLGQLEGNAFRLGLTQAGTDVTGNGSVTAGTTSFPLSVAGTVTGASFTLTISSSGFSPLNFAGSFGKTTMTGTVNGSGFTNAAVTLTKQ